ncbi:MAG: NAD kinase, partial [Pseudomonadota bacterium]
MAKFTKVAFVAADVPIAQTALDALSSRFGNVTKQDADVIVALGGDGFMLQTLHQSH